MEENAQTDTVTDDVTGTELHFFAEENGETAENQVGNGGETPGDGGNPAENGDSVGETCKNGDSETDLSAKIAELEAKSEELAAQLAESRDQLLRKAADFENFRKRMNQEKQNAIEFANQSLLLDIIPVIDDFERAIKAAESSAELAGLPVGKAMLDGIGMIEKSLINQLESKWGLKRFNAVGEPFDPNRHEAMMMEKSPEAQEPVVQEDFVKGYMLKDRVIRAAKVKVLMPEEGIRDQGSGIGD